MPTLLEFTSKFLPMEDLDLPLGETKICYNILPCDNDVTNVLGYLNLRNTVVTVSKYIFRIGVLQMIQCFKRGKTSAN